MTNARKVNPLPPFQFSIWMMLVLTVIAALFCSAAAVLGWTASLFGLVYPLASFIVYQVAYAFFARWLTRGSWDGGRHGLTATLSLSVVGAVTIGLLVVLGIAMS